MKITFVSNFINYHQLPFSLAMANMEGVEYTFIATEPSEEGRLKSDGVEMNDVYPFVLKMYESEANRQKALRLIEESEMVISGGFPFKEILKRAKKGKTTFIYTERFYKTMGGREFTLKQKIRIFLSVIRHYRERRNPNVYYLAASAYLKDDLNRYFKNKRPIYKWGYFPPLPELSKEELMKKEYGDVINLVYCGRLIRWKNPLMAIQVTENLLKQGIKAHLSIIGDGELRPSLEKYVEEHDLKKSVTFFGVLPSSRVREEMSKGDIFLFPSNSSEGWGAVLNESMSLGLVPVVSKTVGAAPFLIDDGINGLMFEEENIDDMTKKTLELIRNPERMKEMSIKAFEKIHEGYNADIAVKRVIELYESIEKGEPCPFDEGVCSLC